MKDERPILLGEILRRQSPDALHIAVAAGGHDFRRALQRCLHCRSTEACRAFLASGARDGYEAFCPSAGYVARIAALI